MKMNREFAKTVSRKLVTLTAWSALRNLSVANVMTVSSLKRMTIILLCVQNALISSVIALNVIRRSALFVMKITC